MVEGSGEDLLDSFHQNEGQIFAHFLPRSAYPSFLPKMTSNRECGTI